MLLPMAEGGGRRIREEIGKTKRVNSARRTV